MQRFGSALNLNVHFHILVPDGAWILGPTARGPDPAFRSVRGPTTHDVEDLVVQVADACKRFLDRKGFSEDDAGPAESDPDDAQTLLQQASLAGVAALGRRAGRQARRLQVLQGRPFHLPPGCAACDGYNLHAGVRVAPFDRKGLERLCRTISRPPLGLARLEEQPDGSVLLHLKTPWADGTTALVLSPLKLLERLLALIQPSRKNEILYHGVLAAHAAWRPLVVPRPPADTAPPHLHRRLARSPVPT